MTPVADRAALLARLQQPREWDLAVIGGGSVGLGVALDANQLATQLHQQEKRP